MATLTTLYQFALADFKKFIGTGFYLVLLVVAIGYLLWKKNENRQFAAWVPIGVIILFFNPIAILFLYRQFMWGTYWRMLWMVPLVPVLAYVGVELICKRQKIVERVLVFLVVACIFVCSGKFMYTDERFEKKQNFFKIPTVAIDIAQHIILYSGDWYPTVIVPNELYCYIRQYTSNVRLLYGRDAEGYMGGVADEIEAVYKEMSKQQPDCEYIGEMALKYDVNVVIFNTKFHQLPDLEEMKSYGLYYGGPVGDYIFYVPLVVEE